jgi:carboxyl-terminal processing protease
MINVKKIVLLLCALALFTSCFEDLDDNPISSIDINDFVWKGMNYAYLYKDNIPDLANDRFLSDTE